MINVVFMGSPEFAVPSMEYLAGNFNLIGVVTQPDRPAGRGRTMQPCPVKSAASRLGIEVIQPHKLLHNEEALNQIKDWDPDVIVVAAFGKVLREEILDLPPKGCLNIHASLLPRWRGASPIQASILHGDEYTGITIMKMDPGLDTGPILMQKEIDILPDDTAASLEERLADLGARMIIDVLPAYIQGAIEPQAQPENGITYAPLLRKEDGELDFSQSPEFLARQVRAYNPWPGTFTKVDGVPFKIHSAKPSNINNVPTGNMVIVFGYPAIGTKKGSLVLTEVQPAGKKKMDGKVFLMGYRNWDHQVG
jgi:methionyl-tRNA formyltransferase